MQVRPFEFSDLGSLCLIINGIIIEGGFTAFQMPFDEEGFLQEFVSGSNCVCCYVAVDGDEACLGFQSLAYYDGLPERWADIATFTRLQPKRQGVGRELFEVTRKRARLENLAVINATIRSDNSSGLGFYDSVGFKDYSVKNGVTLQSGKVINLISKKCVV